MSAWVVVFTDRSTTTVEINATGNPGRDEHGAMYLGTRETGKQAFSAKPEGCTGLSFNVHFGNYCPVHDGSTESGGGRRESWRA